MSLRTLARAVVPSVAALLVLVSGCRIAENASSAPCSVRGRVVEKDMGPPVVGAHVEIALGGDEERTVLALTDPEGRFHVGGLHEGTHDLTITDGEARRAHRTLDLRGGDELDLAEITLFHLVDVQGRLVDGDRPLSGWRVVCFTDDGVKDRFVGIGQALEEVVTAPDGRFAFSERLGARGALVATPPDGEPSPHLVRGHDEALVFRLALPAGGVAEVLLDAAKGERWTVADGHPAQLFP